jgi:predicted 3-demethylubiquinone-9 3-methyltransferase (glyoxalase superfamily)
MKLEHKQKITPFLWFNDKAEEAANFYTSIFKDSRIKSISRSVEGTPGAAGTAMSVIFELAGQEFFALNGGPAFTFTEAISLFINCETQQGGNKSRCGWLKDKFGLSWQVVPNALGDLMNDPDRRKAGNVMRAMMKMDKIIIKDLEEAYAQ